MTERFEGERTRVIMYRPEEEKEEEGSGDER
jgi:hypothetical protein